jgi:uncharacterized protein
MLGKASASLTALQYAADQGQPAAQWKLGRMYADGDGASHDDLRAFNYFSQIANSHPDEAICCANCCRDEPSTQPTGGGS